MVSIIHLHFVHSKFKSIQAASANTAKLSCCWESGSTSNSSSTGTSDEDQLDSRCCWKNTRYMELLSKRSNADSSVRGLVRSLAIPEGLCELLWRDNRYFPKTISTHVADALPSTAFKPLVVAGSNKNKTIEEALISLEPSVASNKLSFPFHNANHHTLLS